MARERREAVVIARCGRRRSTKHHGQHGTGRQRGFPGLPSADCLLLAVGERERGLCICSAGDRSWRCGCGGG